ncbi:DUF1697 domain-containing protein [Tsuneonella sp. HG222]
MTRYVALLGAINVGGNRLSMADLRVALEREEFDNVETVVASGNVLFDHDDRPVDGLGDKIAHIVADRFDIRTFAAVRTRQDLEAALAESPFAGKGEDKLVHVHFLAGEPSAEQVDRLIADHAARGGPEKLAPGTRALHIDYVDGAGNSKLTSQFIESRLGCKGTARNVRSIRRIIEKFA